MGMGRTVHVFETDPFLYGVKENTIDLAVFRGALFFPALFRIDFPAIYRVLRPQGIAMVGGGFGKLTPPSVIDGIAKASKDLNLRAGKVEITKETIIKELELCGLREKIAMELKGGLWVIIKKS